jgi:RNA-directed DNA polymerase
MNPYTLARAVAAALLDGEWQRVAMRERVQAVVGGGRGGADWIEEVVDAVIDEIEQGLPPCHELASWLVQQDVFLDAAAEVAAVRWWATGARAGDEMADSPWRVPALATPSELARWLGIDVARLDHLADRRGLARRSSEERMRHYRYAWIAKRGGAYRLLEAPKRRLRSVQRALLDGIVGAIPPHDAAHGFRAGRSVRGFAQPHVGREVVIRVDLEAFFTSVTAARVVAIFGAAGYPDAVARVLAALCTHRTPDDVLASGPIAEPRLRAPHLPQGAPTSGALANLAAYRLDVRVAALAANLGAQYTRYADDIVLSGERALARAAPSIVARIGAIAIEEGFALNFRKTRVMTASERQRITGIVVNAKLGVARPEVERLRAILHNCVRSGPATQNRDRHPDFRAHLAGRIGWVEALDAVKGARLRRVFARIVWDRGG